MEWTIQDLGAVGEFASSIAVLITLVYLTVQVRQGARILRSESRQALVAYDQSGVYKFVEHPELGRLFSQNETPTLVEKSRLMFWIIGQMRTREHEWLQYCGGALDEAAWKSTRDVIYFVIGTQRARALWALCSPYFNEEFVAEVATMMQGVPEIDFWEKLEQVP